MTLRVLLSLARRWLADKSGPFAIGFALLAPLLFGLAGGAADLVAFERNMKRMQDAADLAALAAAREGSLQGWNQQIAEQVALKFASENLGQPVTSPDQLFPAQPPNRGDVESQRLRGDEHLCHWSGSGSFRHREIGKRIQIDRSGMCGVFQLGRHGWPCSLGYVTFDR